MWKLLSEGLQVYGSRAPPFTQNKLIVAAWHTDKESTHKNGSAAPSPTLPKGIIYQPSECSTYWIISSTDDSFEYISYFPCRYLPRILKNERKQWVGSLDGENRQVLRASYSIFKRWAPVAATTNKRSDNCYICCLTLGRTNSYWDGILETGLEPIDRKERLILSGDMLSGFPCSNLAVNIHKQPYIVTLQRAVFVSFMKRT